MNVVYFGSIPWTVQGAVDDRYGLCSQKGPSSAAKWHNDTCKLICSETAAPTGLCRFVAKHGRREVSETMGKIDIDALINIRSHLVAMRG